MPTPTQTITPHSSHWGAFDAVVEDGTLIEARPFPGDPNPSAILNNIPDAVRSPARITQPMIRKGWLENGPGPSDNRGAEPFVPVDWETATELLSAELGRVYGQHGPESVFGGSYGWASAGRFHHAQGQLHRFLNTLGGYVDARNTYSNAAGEVILDRVAGNMRHMFSHATAWPVIAEHTDLIVSFGGMAVKNTDVAPGGATRHTVRDHLRSLAARGVAVELFSPIRDDIPEYVDARWHPLRPGTDVAVMLGLAHTLVTEGLHDRAFLDRYTAGYDTFEPYLLGHTDGTPKTAEWAAAISEIPAETIRDLARRMASSRTLITVSWSLQRADHGEQPPWMGLTLASILGQIGLPGGGYGFGYGAMAYIGEGPLRLKPPVFPQGKNPCPAYIPVARISDMLLNPGEPFQYDGHDLTYPDVKLVYWVGGNPFHHHQDLARLRRAFARPDTIVVHDPFWTPTARHADIVLPATVTVERNDIGAASSDPFLVAMHQAIPPYAQARDDYRIFSDLAAALGKGDCFTEGRDEAAWLRELYQVWADRVAASGESVPSFDDFWETGYLELPYVQKDLVLYDAFRTDPESHPLRSASGKIEIGSDAIAGFGYPDCPGHPTWMPPAEWLGDTSEAAARFPLTLVANNPATRLHSQLDPGATSQASKVQGREPVRINPIDAQTRGISAGQIVRLFNDRGACLAGAVISEAVRPGVVQLSTGAWYDPLDPADPQSLCVHGNPNVLTRDAGTSRLAQGCAGQHSHVQLEPWTAPLPPIRAYNPPPTVERAKASPSG